MELNIKHPKLIKWALILGVIAVFVYFFFARVSEFASQYKGATPLY